MTDGHAYRFESAAHFAQCLRVPVPVHRQLDPANGRWVALISEMPARLLALSGDRSAWVDADGVLHGGDDHSERDGPCCAGLRLGETQRLAWNGREVLALAQGFLHVIDAQTLELRDRFPLPGALDVAPDGLQAAFWLGCEGLFRLDFRRAESEALEPSLGMAIERSADAAAPGIASVGKTLYLLDRHANRLFARLSDGTVLSIELADLPGKPGADFVAEDLCSDGQALLLTGHWHHARSPVAGFLAVGETGDPLFSGSWDAGQEPVLLAISGSVLLAVFEEGQRWALRSFDGAASLGGEWLLTPVLESDDLGGKWRRAVLTATLPRGATLSINWAATADQAAARLATQIAADTTSPPSLRLARLRTLLPWSTRPTDYVGEANAQPPAAENFSATLSDAQGNFLWLALKINRQPSGDPPRIVRLTVRHDEPALMDYLPAVFQTPIGDGDGTLRRLVDVLEATFLGFDETITALADRLDPDRTAESWLGSLATLLGLPFDDALSRAERQGLLRAAPAILAGRGTAKGVRALLVGVLGDRAYRVIDHTERQIPVTLGGNGFAGSRLPGLLEGPSQRVPTLNARLVLGRTPLGQIDPCNDVPALRGAQLRVIVPAVDEERRRLDTALRQMLEALMPAGVQLDLRWTGLGAAGGELLATIESWPTLTLGAARPGTAQLGGSREPRLREDGLSAEHRLM